MVERQKGFQVLLGNGRFLFECRFQGNIRLSVAYAGRMTSIILQIKCLVKIKGNRDKVRKEIDSKTCIDICQYKAAYVECQFAKQESRSAALPRISLQAAFHKAAQQYECEQREEGGRPHLYRQE